MKTAYYSVWLDEHANQLNPAFEQIFQTVKAHFFARDPNRWPLYRIHEIARWLEERKIDAPTVINTAL